MGAYLKLHERRTERRLSEDATRGVRPPDTAAVPVPLGTGPSDLRASIPPLGLREYWYPAVPARRVGRRKPLYWRMLGEELVLFRTSSGVAAVSDVCPHRGASLSRGRCFFAGTVSCPYHGATFDKDGECVAVLAEGPGSRMPGKLRVRKYPTVVLRGWIFIWMGEGIPAPVSEDVPPEFFEGKQTVLLSDYTYWPANWIISIENQNDSHNQLYVHRNSWFQIKRKGRERTPVGPRVDIIEDRAIYGRGQNQNFYADADGTVPFQLEHEGVGTWPKTRARQLIWRAFRPWNEGVVYSSWRRRLSRLPYQSPAEWGGSLTRGGGGWHLPSAVRINFGYAMYTRWVVPVSQDLSRVVYFHNRRTRWPFTRLALRIWFYAYYNWFMHYNFSGQDSRAAMPCRYWTPERLFPTDSQLIALRRLISSKSRDVIRQRAGAPQGGERGGFDDEAIERAVAAARSGAAERLAVSAQPPDAVSAQRWRRGI